MQTLGKLRSRTVPFAVVLKKVNEFGRVDVLTVCVCSRSDEFEHVFRHEDGEEPGEGGSRDGGHEDVTAWFDECVETAEEIGGPIDVFEDLHCTNNVESLALLNYVFGGAV